MKKIHLYYLDKNWKKEKRTAKNYNLIIDFENKTFEIYITPILMYTEINDIEVVRKSELLDYVEFLKNNNFKEI